MKTKRPSTVVISTCVLLFVAQSALAFYNPSTGRWLNRDPIGEEGGSHVYAFVLNDGVRQTDSLGLATLRFEVVTGKPWRGWPNGAGIWAQPFWAGSGDHWIDNANAMAGSVVTLHNEHNPWWPWYDGVYCNTVTYPHRHDPENNVGHAGSILVFLRDDECRGGRFRVQGSYSARLLGAGPAQTYATTYLYAGYKPQTLLSRQFATQQQSIAYDSHSFSLDVMLPRNGEVLVVRYEPVLRFTHRKHYGGVPSYGMTEAMIWINTVSKL